MTDDSELRFQQVYDEHHAKILRYLTRLVGATEAEDLTQEVFVKIGQALETFRGEASLATWLYRIATNAALDRLRRPAIRQAAEKMLPMVEDGGETVIGEGAASAEEGVIHHQMNGCIREIIGALPEAYRSVIILSELEGLKDAEIAGILGVTLRTAKMRLHRARAKLREELTAACVLYRDERNELACDRKPR